MSLMKKPEMDVIRFKENDIVVASNGRHIITEQSIEFTGLTGGVAGDGTVTYNGIVYPLTSYADVSTFIKVLRDDGIANAGVSTGGTPQSLRGTLRTEASDGAKYFSDGVYYYDPSATWSVDSNTYEGVFIRQ